MELEVICRGSRILWCEECPICNQKHFLMFVKFWGGPFTHGEENREGALLTPCPQDEATEIKCYLCNTRFKMPKKVGKSGG